MDLDLKKQIEGILIKYITPESNNVFVFGSRASGEFKEFSDLDIGVEGAPVDGDVLENLRDEFENSEIPFVVDLVDFNDVSEEFKREASKHLTHLF